MKIKVERCHIQLEDKINISQKRIVYGMVPITKLLQSLDNIIDKLS